MLRSRESLLVVFSGSCVERQVELWRLDKIAGMARVLERVADRAMGRVDVNVAENWLRYWIVIRFRGGLKRKMKESLREMKWEIC